MHVRRNIVHLDIKPENILINKNDEAKITDFGISINLEDGKSDQIFNPDWGTKQYKPPETFNSRLRSTESLMFGKPMDVWALGCTFYQLIYNEFPFETGPRQEDFVSSVLHKE